MNIILFISSFTLYFSLCSFKVSAEFVISGLVIGGSLLGTWYKSDLLKDYTFCKFTECCNSNYLSYDLDKLQKSLSDDVYGQPLVNEIVNILDAHYEVMKSSKRKNEKALVISFHGWSGVGKNYVVKMIAESLYKRGMESKYVKVFMGSKNFDCSDIYKTKKKFIEEVDAIVKNCPRSLIILDEIHKMCPSIIDALMPMLDYHHEVDGVDYRNTIFIFLSNIGGTEIATGLLDLYNHGLKRDDAKFHHFEPILRRAAYYSGGFEKSYVIAQHLIDHYIPFLPLEQQHVEMCARAAFRANGIDFPTEDMMADALTVVTYGPTEDQPIFANNGCKRFTHTVPYIIKKHSTKSKNIEL